jgi:hypothetical protein
VSAFGVYGTAHIFGHRDKAVTVTPPSNPFKLYRQAYRTVSNLKNKNALALLFINLEIHTDTQFIHKITNCVFGLLTRLTAHNCARAFVCNAKHKPTAAIIRHSAKVLRRFAHILAVFGFFKFAVVAFG